MSTARSPEELSDDVVERIKALLAKEGLDPDEVLEKFGAKVLETPEPPRPKAVEVVSAVETTQASTTEQVWFPADYGREPTVTEYEAVMPERIARLKEILAAEGLDPDKVMGETVVDSAEKTDPEADVLATAEVEFRGRMIRVKTPETEQIMIINRMAATFGRASQQQNISAQKAIKLMDRAFRAVCSVIINPADIEWLEELFLDGDLRLEETIPIITTATRALRTANEGNTNRAERRAAARSSGQTGAAALDTTEA